MVRIGQMQRERSPSGSLRCTGLAIALLGLAFAVPAQTQAGAVAEPVPVVRGIPAPDGSPAIALCPDIGEWPKVFEARDGSGLAGRLAHGRQRVFLVDPWDTTAARIDGFDGVARDVYPALLERLHELGGGDVTWIGHGLCGLLPVAAAARASANAPATRWVALGTRFSHRDPSPLVLEWLRAWHGGERPLPDLLTSLLFTGLRPSLGSRKSSVPHALAAETDSEPDTVLEAYHRTHLSRPPPKAVLEDLLRWYETGAMYDSQGWVDYERGYDSVTGPALIVAGASDPMAPVEDVLPAIERLPSEVGATWHLLSRVNGDKEEYGHLGMLLSRHSARDVDALVTAWMQGRRRLP
jgi:hypothetical protein